MKTFAYGVIGVAFAALSPAAKAAASAPVEMPQCSYDRSIYKLPPEKFDQDMQGGWRKIAREPGCKLQAANVIRIYRAQMEARVRGMYWHEAQLHALEGDTRAAIGLMKKARVPKSQDAFGFNLYVDATVAFLKKNKPAFLRAQRRLMAMTKPDQWEEGQEWPVNGKVVTILASCFEGSYENAYEHGCKAPVPTAL